MKSDINEFNDKRNNLLVNTVDFQEKYDRSKRKRDDILDKVEDLLDKIQDNH
jgi:L-lactate utilization protein LutB